ncbi:MAG: agmatine deiminase family protein [Ahrensia sp.]|nr:agmatine deiminase family protein [Ahrensia sp.]
MITRRKFNRGLTAFGAMAGGAGILSQAGSARAAMNTTNPLAHGFNMPEEAAPHERTFMQWPANLKVYKYREDLEAVQEAIALIANTINRFEPVVMLAAKGEHALIRSMTDDIEIWDIPTDDLWCRDASCNFVLNSAEELAAVNLNFNGWGKKQPHANDAKVSQRIAQKLGLHLFNNDLVGEAGGVEYDGRANLIAHESSWVNDNRNPGMSRDEVSELIKQAYGAKHMVWAPGIKGADITDYHIDALARFTPSGAIIIQMPDELDKSDPWSVAAFQTNKIFSNAVNDKGRAFEMITLPEPTRVRSKSDDFVASYVNYYVCNGAVITAEFGDDKTDQAAVEILGKAYPGREIVALNIDAIGESGGGIHCATHEQFASKAIWKPQ